MVSKATFSHQPCGQAGLLRTGSRGCGKFSRLARGGSWLRILWPCRERGENLLWLTPKADGPLLAQLFLINWAGLSFGADCLVAVTPKLENSPTLHPCYLGLPAGVPWAWAVSVAQAHSWVAQGQPSLSPVSTPARKPCYPMPQATDLWFPTFGQGDRCKGRAPLTELMFTVHAFHTWHSKLFFSINSLNPMKWYYYYPHFTGQERALASSWRSRLAAEEH